MSQIVVSENECLPDPKTLEPGKIYVPCDYTAASFLCPCGCGREVYIPLGDGDRCWQMVSKDPLSIVPSILDRGCGAHYYVTKGEFRMC